jgi:hypothetical protein
MVGLIGQQGVCDICNAGVMSPYGHLLTTQQVVSSPMYWLHYYEAHKAEFQAFGIASFDQFRQNPAIRDMCSSTLAGQKTPWMVCEACIIKFNVDRAQTQGYARQFWGSGKLFEPPGSGPAPLSAVDMGKVGTMPSYWDNRPAAGTTPAVVSTPPAPATAPVKIVIPTTRARPGLNQRLISRILLGIGLLGFVVVFFTVDTIFAKAFVLIAAGVVILVGRPILRGK